MVTREKLDPTLQAFKDSYDGTNASVSTAQGAIVTALGAVSTQLAEAVTNYNAAGSDSQIAALVSCVELANQGVEAVKTHVDGDISALLGDCAGVRAIVTEIEDYVEKNKNEPDEIVETPGDPDKGTADVMGPNPMIDYYNECIRILNQKGLDYLNAIKDAMDAVDMGVKGNMKQGGSVGAGNGYNCNFNANDPKYTLPTAPGSTAAAASTTPNVWEKIGLRFSEDARDTWNDICNRWGNIDGLVSAIANGIGIVYEGADFIVEEATNVVTGLLDIANAGLNGLFDLSWRSSSTDQYWENIGLDYAEDWTTFGTGHWYNWLGNIPVGILRTVVDAVQTVQNGAVTAADWVIDDALGSVVDWVGDAWGWVSNWIFD